MAPVSDLLVMDSFQSSLELMTWFPSQVQTDDGERAPFIPCYNRPDSTRLNPPSMKGNDSVEVEPCQLERAGRRDGQGPNAWVHGPRPRSPGRASSQGRAFELTDRFEGRGYELLCLRPSEKRLLVGYVRSSATGVEH